MKLKEYSEKLQPFVFHGVSCEAATSGTAKADCPFCGREGKMGINVSTGQFRCVRCETTGNVYTFLEKLLAESLQETTDEDYEELAHARSLSVSGLKAFGFAKSKITGEWLIPGYNTKPLTDSEQKRFKRERGKLANLYRCVEFLEEVPNPALTPSPSTPHRTYPTSNLAETFQVIKYRVQATVGCKIQPMGTQTLTPSQTTRYISEGPWDGVALYDFFHKYDLRGDRYIRTMNPTKSMAETHGVFAAPSAGNFQDEWLVHVDGHNAVISFDNDYPKVHPETGKVIMQNNAPLCPGWNGTKRILDMLPKSEFKPLSVKYVKWGEQGYSPDLADGYDIRDLIKERTSSALAFLAQFLHTYQAPKRHKKVNGKESSHLLAPITRTSFEELAEDFDASLSFGRGMRDTLVAMLGCITSTELPQDPFWLKVIGPPGSGKTTLAECVSAARSWVYPKSILTGFHSGSVNPDDPEDDRSLFKEIQNKTIVVKDADTIVKSSRRDTILSELRDIYDGASRAAYRHGKKDADYENIRVTFILCGTDVLRSLSRDTYLGERFLDCEILDESFDCNPVLDRASSNSWDSFSSYFGSSPKEGDPTDQEVHSDDQTIHLKQCTIGFIKYIKENMKGFNMPEFPPVHRATMKSLALFLAYMRARVQRSGHDMDYRPRIEVGGRLTKQLNKLALCSSLVLGKTNIDEEILHIVRKLVLDTSLGFQFDITRLLLEHPKGLSAMQIRHELQLPETTIRKWILDMQELHIIERRSASNNSGQRGRDTHLWRPTQIMQSLWSTINPA